MADLVINPVQSLTGTIVLPGDKSISHRSVMLAGLADGETVITGFLTGEDTMNTARAMQALGVEIEGIGTPRLVVRGRGLHGLTEPSAVLDLGNAGTGMRLVAGLLAGQNFFSVLTGDQYLRKRPMARIVDPLRKMGAVIDGRADGKFAPLAIRGSRLRAIDYESPIASAQVKSAILLAALFAEGTSSVNEPSKSRDHTERMLRFFGVDVHEEGTCVSVRGRQQLKSKGLLEIPSDISSAAFFMVAACIVPGSNLLIKNIGVNPTRTGVIDILHAMGADIMLENLREQAGEPVADIRVRHARLRSTEIAGDVIPRAIDEIPILAVAAAYADGTTVIRDASELRVKESDRIATMAAELRRMGVGVQERPDGMEVTGGARLTGAVCQSHGDHRIAMSVAIAGLRATGETTIRDAAWIDTSFPGFASLLRGAVHA
jgi:3-phosphoshikimate 1-carboxyvinyltransferase